MNADQTMLQQMKHIQESGIRPRLLLNSCCGPCSTSVLEQLTAVFEVVVHFCNPNLHSEEEYHKRLAAQEEVLEALTIPLDKLLEQGWSPEGWRESISSIPFDKEGGNRCRACIAYRMNRTAALAAEKGFQWFTTTLSVSPHKDAAAINEIGAALEKRYGVRYLGADFKKRGGYQRSITLSKEYRLYRQDHCGCAESLDGRNANKKNEVER